MDVQNEIITEKNFQEKISKKAEKLLKKNQKLKALFNSKELPYKTFYSSLLVLTAAFIIGALAIGSSPIDTLIAFFLYQIGNFGVSLLNTALREIYISKKITWTTEKLSDLEKQLTLSNAKVRGLEKSFEKSKAEPSLSTKEEQTFEFSKKEKLDTLKEYSKTLKDIKEQGLDKTLEEKENNKTL